MNRTAIRVGGVDLGGSWATTGTATLTFDAGPPARFVACLPRAIAWPEAPVTSAAMADAIDAWAARDGLRAVAIDGPPAWRDPNAARLADLPALGPRGYYVLESFPTSTLDAAPPARAGDDDREAREFSEKIR
jgi:hypothetical protein